MHTSTDQFSEMTKTELYISKHCNRINIDCFYHWTWQKKLSAVCPKMFDLNVHTCVRSLCSCTIFLVSTMSCSSPYSRPSKPLISFISVRDAWFSTWTTSDFRDSIDWSSNYTYNKQVLSFIHIFFTTMQPPKNYRKIRIFISFHYSASISFVKTGIVTVII